MVMCRISYFQYPKLFERTEGSQLNSPGFQPWVQSYFRMCVLKVSRNVLPSIETSRVLSGHCLSPFLNLGLKSQAVLQ